MKKGFTLVELMGVIVLLSILVIIAVPAITGTIKSGKDDLYEAQLRSIETAAKNWASDPENVSKLPKSGECSFILLSDLKKGNYVDLDIKNPKNNKQFPDTMHIEIKRTNKKLSFNADQSKLDDSCQPIQ
jgi:prepilin-type N-terminal cleavage/methylation domain-containing protein